MVKKTPEATEAYNENQLCGLFVFFEKKSDKYFRVFDIRCFYIFKLVNSRTRCYRVIVLLEFQVWGIISAIHTIYEYIFRLLLKISVSGWHYRRSLQFVYRQSLRGQLLISIYL